MADCSSNNYNRGRKTDREKYAKGFLRLPSSKKHLARLYVLLNPIPRSNRFFPDDLNKQLAKAFAKDADEFLQGPALSRVLKELKDEGIILNIKGKKNIKHDIGEILIKERKGGEYNSSKRVGQYSVYKTTSDVQDLLDVLDNPVALEIIHSSLKSSGLFKKFFKLLFKNLTYILSTDDEKTQRSIVQGFNMVRPLRPDDSNFNDSDLQQIATIMKKVDEKKLECIASEFANDMMKDDNLLNAIYLLSALPTKL